jgi:AmmeMemoRadiSam system protein B
MLSTHPLLRSHVVKEVGAGEPRSYHLVDRLGLAAPLRVSAAEFTWLDLFDGKRSLTEMQSHSAKNGVSAVNLDQLTRFVNRLDDNLLLEGPRFRQVVDAPTRPPRCIGCYEGEPEALRRQLASFFTHPEGPGLPSKGRETRGARHDRPGGHLQAALIPHIDYPRGGVTYAWAFKELVEQTDAGLFVIIGTSHFSQQRFTLTRKNFETPLGVVPTDQDYIDRLVSHFGSGLFDDEWLAHLPEHSIELEVVFLRYLYEGKRPIRIVPLVVGSFFDCVTSGVHPTARPDIARMVEALRRTQAETVEPICYIISGDLAHIGPKFQDPLPLTAGRLGQSRRQDLAILRQAEAARPAAYFKIVADEVDARNICGLSPTITFLEAIRPSAGKLLHYDQYVHPLGRESVSFASMTFYSQEAEAGK